MSEASPLDEMIARVEAAAQASRKRGRPRLTRAENERRERLVTLYEGFRRSAKHPYGRGRQSGKWRGDPEFNERAFLQKFGEFIIGRPIRSERDLSAARKQLQRARKAEKLTALRKRYPRTWHLRRR